MACPQRDFRYKPHRRYAHCGKFESLIMSQDAPLQAAQVSERDLANAIRALSMDAVQAANSGHPGMPMGMADVATVLFTRFLKFDPAAPNWPDRDRFVLSAGHGSMLLYALLHLCGYEDMTLDQLRNFRQLHSITAGHPEYGHATGIETTTGPLGQGLANAVGMALAERHLNAKFGDDLVDHYTYALVGDGCLMEGISHEAISMAGHFQLAKLIVLFDDNGISIDGPTSLTVGDDQLQRFQASGWHVQQIDGHDSDAVAAALQVAKAAAQPSVIACKTTIGFGAPTKAGTAGSHGAPLGPEEIAGTREALDWPHPPFEIPDKIRTAWRQAGARNRDDRIAWEARKRASAEASAFDATIAGDIPAACSDAITTYKSQIIAAAPKKATRALSGDLLESLRDTVPALVGGSADLTGSNNTKAKQHKVMQANDFAGQYIHYGVREHGMAAAMNGMALHGGVIPYGGTFLVFTDYCRPAIRLSALMQQRVIYVMTHDSIGLGEDGPTHQPVEHLAALRAMPNLLVMRPADGVEVAECWQIALQHANRPSVICLSRQGLPTVRQDADPAQNRAQAGAYELRPADGPAQVSLIASGSEVSIALDTQARLAAANIAARVVSLPCFELLDALSPAQRSAVLGAGTLKVGIEAGIAFGWERILGPNGIFVGMSGFGASAPAGALYAHFGLTADAVVERVKKHLAS